MCLSAKRSALVTLLALALCQDLRGSSLVATRVVFPGDSNNNDPGYFGPRGRDQLANASRETKKERETATKLVGGTYARIGQFPWMAIVHRLTSGGKILICGGTIISVRWILTAGHCVVNSPRKFLIVLGEVDKIGIDYDVYEGPGISMITTRGALHPRFNPTVNDVALLWMPRDIVFSSAIRPIRLAGRNEANERFAGEIGTVVGWGREYSTATHTARLLKYASIPVISNEECAASWNVVENNICTAVGSRIDACQGDSGGPLVVQVKGEYLQIGIVSYGDRDCSSSLPGVFARVSSFAPWIEQVTGIKF